MCGGLLALRPAEGRYRAFAAPARSTSPADQAKALTLQGGALGAVQTDIH